MSLSAGMSARFRRPNALSGVTSLTLDELRVLVAEDDRTSGLFLKKMLAKHGIEVTLAKDGERALELLAETRHDVVLMDIQMPVMDGVTTTRAIRAGKAGKDNTDIPHCRADRPCQQGGAGRLPRRGHGQPPAQAGGRGRAARAPQGPAPRRRISRFPGRSLPSPRAHHNGRAGTLDCGRFDFQRHECACSGREGCREMCEVLRLFLLLACPSVKSGATLLDHWTAFF